MLSNFDFKAIWDALPYLLLTGMRFTLTLTILSTIGAVILGTGFALMRLSQSPVLRTISAIYINFMRSMPFVLIIFWVYFLFPYIGQALKGADRPVEVNAFQSALITFILFEAAFFAEIMRAGVQSVPRGQTSAAYALGLNYWKAMGLVILPQAFRNMLPVLFTQAIVLFQDTSLVYVISLTDFMGAANKVAQRDGRLVEMYVFAAVVYFLISYLASLGVRRLQAKTAIIR